MELLTLLTTANEAGFQSGAMITLILIYFRMESRNKKRHKEIKAENDLHWTKLIDTLKGNDEKNEKRFTTIETHIGLKKP